jgi:hypothetical protein
MDFCCQFLLGREFSGGNPARKPAGRSGTCPTFVQDIAVADFAHDYSL